MTAKEVWVVKILLEIGSALFGLLVVVCLWIDALRDENYEPDKRRFHTVWRKIHESRWLRMPESAVLWLLKAERTFTETAERLAEDDESKVKLWVMAPIVLIFPFVFLRYFFHLSWAHTILLALAIMSLSVPLFVLLLVPSVLFLPDAVGRTLCAVCFLGFLFGTPICAALGMLLVTVNVPLYLGTVLMFVLAVPLFLVIDYIGFWIFDLPGSKPYIKVPFHRQGKLMLPYSVRSHSRTLASAMCLSFVITYLSFCVGHMAKPEAPVPQTFQMLLSNVIFDGATVFATVMILTWAVSKSSFLRLPIAIVVDMVIGAILACCSLHFGLVFSKNALTVPEVMNVLIARSRSGSHFELSPYFWAMHTTFLPTLFYLLVILLCWVAKAILYPAVWFFGVARTLRNPWKLTIAVLTLFSIVLGTLAYGVGAIEYHLKEKEKPRTVDKPMPLPNPDKIRDSQLW